MVPTYQGALDGAGWKYACGCVHRAEGWAEWWLDASGSESVMVAGGGRMPYIILFRYFVNLNYIVPTTHFPAMRVAVCQYHPFQIPFTSRMTTHVNNKPTASKQALAETVPLTIIRTRHQLTSPALRFWPLAATCAFFAAMKEEAESHSAFPPTRGPRGHLAQSGLWLI